MRLALPLFISSYIAKGNNMSHNPNSHMAHQAIKADGTISRQKKAIYELLSDGVARTSREISKSLDMDRTSVTGRITAMKERRDKYKVLVKENKICPVTHKVVEWYTV